mmetsp:Transcript_59114/g.139114  ORF Transcript_59114/g.139114 Transcript_59114/m.139114 type:complete len:212 (-) Transcript_59114:51-686(-)
MAESEQRTELWCESSFDDFCHPETIKTNPVDDGVELSHSLSGWSTAYSRDPVEYPSIVVRIVAISKNRSDNSYGVGFSVAPQIRSSLVGFGTAEAARKSKSTGPETTDKRFEIGWFQNSGALNVNGVAVSRHKISYGPGDTIAMSVLPGEDGDVVVRRGVVGGEEESTVVAWSESIPLHGEVPKLHGVISMWSTNTVAVVTYGGGLTKAAR